jgi:putative ABC transport system permease protein
LLTDLSPLMLRRLITLTLRTLRNRLGYTLIGGLGLTVALACTGLVALYLQFETSYDAFHDGADRIGRVFATANDRAPLDGYKKMNGLVAQRTQERVTGIEAATALDAHSRPVYLRGPEQEARGTERVRLPEYQSYFVPASDGFLRVFDGYEVLQGTRTEALQAPGEAVITRSMAERLFGTADAVGRSFTLFFGAADLGARDTDDNRETLTVRAVTADPPTRSHLGYQIVYSVPTSSFTSWTGAFTYFRLAPEADRETVLGEVLPAWNSLYPDKRPTDEYRAVFEPITDIHLNRTDTRYLWALGLLAVVILVVAGANYTNLAAAMYAGRSREVGARKALGAGTGQVGRQFVFESVVLALLCVPVAMGLASALTPAFNRLMDTAIAVPATRPLAWLGMAVGAALFGAVAGAYPAWGVARRSVPALFEGSDFGRSGRGGLTVRRGLVVAQFALFIALGSAAVLMQQQVRLLQTADLGFDASGVVEITNGAALIGGQTQNGGGRDVSQSRAFQRELARNPAVKAIATGQRFLRGQEYGLSFKRTDGETTPTVEANPVFVDPNALSVLGIQTRGPYFRTPPAERRDSVAVVTPEVLAELGCEEEQLGSSCRIRNNAPDEVTPSLPVVGVAENVWFGPVSGRDRPNVFYLIDQENRTFRLRHNVFVRFAEGVPRSEQVQALEATWATFAPDIPLQYEVLTDRIASFYAQDRRLRTLSFGLTGVAMALVLLGLLAIVAYLTRLRLKEVAIRKALGATVPSILRLLNREFVVLVGVAFVLGSALSYLAMSEWLSGFATRIDVSPLVFLAVGIVALLLSVAAVSVQSLSAARVDPARVLRSE